MLAENVEIDLSGLIYAGNGNMTANYDGNLFVSYDANGDLTSASGDISFTTNRGIDTINKFTVSTNNDRYFITSNPDSVSSQFQGLTHFSLTYDSEAPASFSDIMYRYPVENVTGPELYDEYEGDSTNGNVTSAVIACFVTGTLIRTARGDAAVEDLRIGDSIVTSFGTHRPILWLGHRTIDCGRHANPASVMPIFISAHAFDKAAPSRDLFVSPGHSICVDVFGEVLIPAGALVNDLTIRQVDVDKVTYWHLELDSHDVVLAENLPAESYLDMGNRGTFAENAVIDLSAAPDGNPAHRTHANFCRPFHDSGVIVDAVRAQIRARATALRWTRGGNDLVADLHLIVDGIRI